MVMTFLNTNKEAKDRHIDEGFSYYEYKYLVLHEELSHVRKLLDEFYGHSDPFPQGIVDSIYYDTLDEQLFAQCLDGDAVKHKFRVRGYGDGRYGQVQQKIKNLATVSKLKNKIIPVAANGVLAAEWNNFLAQDDEGGFHQIRYNATRFGPLLPSIRVRYLRHRYRAYDYRITLDTNIEVSALANGLPRSKSHGTLDHHVLEIKTREMRPLLPFNGLINLQQVSFSKFMLGLLLLRPTQ